MAVRAPDFRAGLEWVNTGGRALSLADFRGRPLLLDFWTYGCINCLNLIPELQAVEARYGEGLAVVGVHAGKFPHERETANVALACERLGVRHPVVNDRHFRTWREYAVRAWPTLVLVSPTGYVLWTRMGEVPAAELALRLEEALGGALRPSPAPPPCAPAPPAPRLRFPAKVLPAPGGRLYVSDTGNGRVVRVDLDAGGLRGRAAASYDGARPGEPGDGGFRAPHGLALRDDTLYVADPLDHRVRALSLESGEGRPVAGTGAQARRREGGGPALEVPLNAPWDLLWHGDRLLIAMAGWHQIWALDPERAVTTVVAGSGAEEVYDAEPAMAALAQPSALASDGERVWFADAESSAIRELRPDGVETLVGTGLFDFGDRDGAGEEVRLQHPQGVAWWREGERLLVADSYNGRVRRLDPRTRQVEAVTPAGALLDPGGIGIAPGARWAYLADTHRHAVRAVDPETGRMETVEIEWGT